ncbi:hypothetical protein ACSHWB_09920 [Lentzea sp. HUAS TT2]|uniref:hypothetical protein n=1 Tax=Lentzea sp. HUAS TT2 TaxID=3447454 RepID=UPI003F70D485
MRPVQISVGSHWSYEVEFDEGDRRQRFTVEVDGQGQISGLDDHQPMGDLVLAVHRARHEAVTFSGRALLRLARISALPDESFELVFEAGETSCRFVCEAHESSGISYVTSEPALVQPNPAYTGPDVGDPRPVVSVVLAMHRARHQPFGQERESR